jgi:hypothetical protein
VQVEEAVEGRRTSCRWVMSNGPKDEFGPVARRHSGVAVIINSQARYCIRPLKYT